MDRASGNVLAETTTVVVASDGRDERNVKRLALSGSFFTPRSSRRWVVPGGGVTGSHPLPGHSDRVTGKCQEL